MIYRTVLHITDVFIYIIFIVLQSCVITDGETERRMTEVASICNKVE